MRFILDLCGGTGAWSYPYKQAGYNVKVIDLPMDVRLLQIPEERVHGILAAPPCTMFANSGARWSRTENQIREALSIVDACLRLVVSCKPDWWALENPVGKLKRYLGSPLMYFDPCDYGDPYTKKTCLWGNFNIPLKHPIKVQGKNPIHYMGPSLERAKKRSITPVGFAKAFFKANP